LAPIRVGAFFVSAYELRSFDNETNYQSFFSLDVYSKAIQQLFRQMMLSDMPYAQIEGELHIVRSTLCRWRKGLGLPRRKRGPGARK
jgi:transposase-like protein